MPNVDPLLEVRNLSVTFGHGNTVPTVKNVSFSVSAGETLCLVGESGSGKSVSAMSLLQLLPDTAHVEAEAIRFDGRDIRNARGAELQALRGGGIAFIFQDPMSSLNPVLTVRQQMNETIRQHRGVSWSDADKVALSALEQVRIPETRRRMGAYPHELSGGMRQRVMIAMAISCQPKLLVADEPTTALDVTIQSQILALIDELKETLQTGVLFITHDLGVVAEIADNVAVMYAGEIVETGPVDALFENPVHAYTLGLMRSSPRRGEHRESLQAIPGSVPDLSTRPVGCMFSDRCFLAEPACVSEPATLNRLESGQQTRCRRYGAVAAQLREAANA